MSYQKITGTLMAWGYQKLGTQKAMNDMYVTQNNWDGTQISPTLTKNNAGGGQRMPDKENFNAVIGEVNMKTVVRRLTPLECERLQGFPDGWTDIGEWTDSKGKKHKEADSPRYKALGNSIAVGYANNQSGFWMVLMKRISAQYERSATLGSMFDGISGFPLAWARYNGAENCRWSSEIEEFPIAVCKKHFGDEEAGIEGDIKEYL
jgi:DNA (cytosine-5)-methyltransferase 1